jgi:hypothetical protein
MLRGSNLVADQVLILAENSLAHRLVPKDELFCNKVSDAVRRMTTVLMHVYDLNKLNASKQSWAVQQAERIRWTFRIILAILKSKQLAADDLDRIVKHWKSSKP